MSIYDGYGWQDSPRMRMAEMERIRAMSWPVRCTHCNRVYDGGKVTVIQRYADCSVWVSPCCRIQVDDRGTGPFGKSRRDITELDRATGEPRAD